MDAELQPVGKKRLRSIAGALSGVHRSEPYLGIMTERYSSFSQTAKVPN